MMCSFETSILYKAVGSVNLFIKAETCTRVLISI